MLSATEKTADGTDGGRNAFAWLKNVGLIPEAAGLARERHPGHVATFTGLLFDILEPDPQAIQLEDVAHALSHVNRFTGHTPFPYSVAQHSTLCADEAAMRWPDRPLWHLACLLHDAAEAYCGDVSRPLKQLIGSVYRPIEDRLQAAVWARFGVELTADVTAAIHACDNAVVMAEARAMFRGSEAWNWGDTRPSELPIVPMDSEHAAWGFRQRFHVLYAASFGRYWQDTAPHNWN